MAQFMTPAPDWTPEYEAELMDRLGLEIIGGRMVNPKRDAGELCTLCPNAYGRVFHPGHRPHGTHPHVVRYVNDVGHLT